jgi:hypothetical protein
MYAGNSFWELKFMDGYESEMFVYSFHYSSSPLYIQKINFELSLLMSHHIS